VLDLIVNFCWTQQGDWAVGGPEPVSIVEETTPAG
jgi:hypothetical protein